LVFLQVQALTHPNDILAVGDALDLYATWQVLALIAARESKADFDGYTSPVRQFASSHH